MLGKAKPVSQSRKDWCSPPDPASKAWVVVRAGVKWSASTPDHPDNFRTWCTKVAPQR